MKIATFNMENIFHRDQSLVKRSISRSLSSWIEEFENLLKSDQRSENDFVRMRELSFLLGFHKSSLEPYVVMRRKAGQLFLQKRDAGFEYKASHMSNWNGWVKLHSNPINEIAVQLKAQAIIDVNPDVLVLQEVEDRQSLLEFNEEFLPEEVRYSEVFVIPGNDDRGREMAIMTKNGYKIKSIISHSNEYRAGEKLFDKDLQEYEVQTPAGDVLWILSANLIELDDNRVVSDEKRKQQAERMAEVYDDLWGRGNHRIAVMGTFNSPSYCDSLSPLLRATGLQEIKKHQMFNVDYDEGKDAVYHSLGAYKMGVNLKQKDYLLLSPDFFKEIKKAGLNRKGVWPENKAQYRTYPALQCESQQASTHPLLWVDVNFKIEAH